MRNPLIKRLPRELKKELGKYIALFLFLAMMISLESGFLVADGSMTRAYDESFTKFNIEDGHFELEKEAPAAVIDKIEKEGVTVYPLFYKDKPMNGKKTVRVFTTREKVNLQDLMEGSMPEGEDEIALDRLFGSKNGISPGDKIDVDGHAYTVTGYVALSDYSAMFENNADIMFDNSAFGVGITTEEGYQRLNRAGLHYCYAWTFRDKALTDKEKGDKAEDIMKIILNDRDAELEDMIQQQENQAIMFTGDDMGSDRNMFVLFLYIIMVVLAFVFGVTTRSTLEQEAGAIGTLRASGFTRGEMLRHYLVLPTAMTLAAALVGNIIGYTGMKYVMAGLYYNSYSLPTYTTIWNGEAFVATTVVPCIIITLVDLVVLHHTFRLTPLQFLRHEMKSRKHRRALRLPPGLPFLSRFRLRVILQNRSTYLLLVLGIFLSCMLLAFSFFMKPLLVQFASVVDNSMIARYQYILKEPDWVEDPQAEAYSVTSLKVNDTDEISVYGIGRDSRYLPDVKLPEGANEVVASSGYMDKYDLKVGDIIRLHKKYSNKIYRLRIVGEYKYDMSFALFMSRKHWSGTFDMPAMYFNGYYSDKVLSELDPENVASVITEDDMKKVSRQLQDSMGGFFKLFSVFSVIMYMLLVYLLAKLVVDKNADAISMVKILGYSNRESGLLYNRATTIVVVVSLLVCAPVSCALLKQLYGLFMMTMHGWLPYYQPGWMCPAMIVSGIISYGVISRILQRRIDKIPMALALKNME